ncbi:MAG: hypothetical protein LBD78_10755 [Spirochaetaceae bacterium]|jgi:hypothetical protein|nr:hypothetical protein [Spirochaetaceae bacterium]
MFRYIRIPLIVLAFLSVSGSPVFSEPFKPEVLRGEVQVDLEPVYARYADESYPPDIQTTRRRALEESALFYGAMIYGWSFNYDIGEKARGIAEELALEPLGEIPFGDPGLQATDVYLRDTDLCLFTDYRLNDAQQRRMLMWNSGTIRTVQATGYGPLGGPVEGSDWIAIKKTALEDAARAGIRAMLRGSERNRPKEARGFIALTAFPRYWMDAGQWAAAARFRVVLTELVPFGAY